MEVAVAPTAQRERDGRVGLILKAWPRLSEVFVLNEVLLLERLGHDLHIFAMRDPGEPVVHDKVGRVRAPVTYIPDYPWRSFFPLLVSNVRLLARHPGRYWSALSCAVETSLRQRSSATFKRFVQAAYLVSRAFPGTGVTHWHAHFSHDPTTVAWFASRLSGLGFSFSAHAKDIYLQEERFLREKIDRANFVVTCTEYNRRHLEEHSSGTTPVFRCYHGVELGMFPAPRRATGERPPEILSVGRLVPKKGFPVLIEALAELRTRGQDYHCTIVGSGPSEQDLRRRIAEAELEDNIQLVSPLPQSELIEHYRRADLFALPCQVESDGDRDGIPNVIVEAMAMGLPVVSTKISGIPECVENGVDGVLVPERDPHALADGLAEVIGRPELAVRLGRAAREKVKTEFDSLRNVGRISEALYRALDDEWPRAGVR